MKLKFIGKSQDYLQNEAVKTRVILGNDEGAVYPVFFEPSYINKSIAELEVLALEKIYQDNFPDKAEKDKFAELRELVNTAIKTTAENRELNAQNKSAMDAAIVEMTDLVAALYEKLESLGLSDEQPTE